MIKRMNKAMARGIAARGVTAVDLIIAERLVQRRQELGISQVDLGQHTGVTFQQIQKYERGANRVSASRLFAIATALDVPLTYFFDQLKGSLRTPMKKNAGPNAGGRRGKTKNPGRSNNANAE